MSKNRRIINKMILSIGISILVIKLISSVMRKEEEEEKEKEEEKEEKVKCQLCYHLFYESNIVGHLMYNHNVQFINDCYSDSF